MRLGSHFHILAAEDDPNDRFFMEEAFKLVHGPITLNILKNGRAVENYLLRKPPFHDTTDAPFPNLIMLDIKMPGLTGLEILEWMAKTDHFKRIPVMIVSGSSLQQDIDRAFDLGANAYLVKPVGIQKMKHVFQTTADFWNTVSEWPSSPV
jgi:CheY-like chemotaxis protein